MIDLYFATSPNVYKINIALEEMELDYRLVPVDLSQGAHLDPAKLGGAATGKVPVIVDHAPQGREGPVTVVESGAILQYLAEKCGKFIGSDAAERTDVMQWLFWQMGGLGPIGGQLWHFRAFAPMIAPDFDNSYALQRYDRMFARLWRTMDDRLAQVPFLAGAYSIADMACYPWIIYLAPDEGRDSFPNIQRWREAMAARPAVQAAYDRARTLDVGYDRNELDTALMPWDGILQNVITV
ncbi:MAG: glutathione S-transferase N-terminal domain-containing protein [Pseudomonadota bacterium]